MRKVCSLKKRMCASHSGFTLLEESQRGLIVNNQSLEQLGAQSAKNCVLLLETADDRNHVFDRLKVLPRKSHDTIVHIAENSVAVDVEVTSGNISHCA